MRISDWSSDVCSSDLMPRLWMAAVEARMRGSTKGSVLAVVVGRNAKKEILAKVRMRVVIRQSRSEEHTSELQSLMRISYAVFCLKKKTKKKTKNTKKRSYSTKNQQNTSHIN